MSFLNQHEKDLLLILAKDFEDKAMRCKIKAMRPAANKKMYLQQAAKELEKALVLKKVVS